MSQTRKVKVDRGPELSLHSRLLQHHEKAVSVVILSCCSL